MYLVLILCMITCISQVKNSIYQIRFKDKSDTICVYLYESMNTLEVNFRIDLELSVCHFNDSIEKIYHQQLKEILVIQLSDACSLIQQLTILKNTSWIQDYFGIIFSVNHGNDTFEHTLLSYLYNQIKSPVSMSNHSRLFSTSEFPIPSDYIIGFIDSTEVNRLKNLLSNQSNPLLYRLNRENLRFDPSIFLVISIIIICMLIGNEWHRRIFIKKILDHNHSSKRNKFKIGFIIGLLLFICFMILYLLDRYLTFIIKEIYLLSFIIVSSLVIYLCFDHFFYLLIKKFYQRFKLNKDVDLNQIHQWFRLILMFISFIIIILWFLNRFTYVGLILTNFIMFCMTIVLIVQMRLVNLMLCMIIFGFIFLFECLSLILRIGLIIELKDEYEKKLIIINSKFPISIWTANESRNVEEFIYRMYMNMFENSGFDCLLSGGSMNIFKRNVMKWIIRENLPFVFSFPRFIRDNDGCGFHAGRIYLSIDDIIFPSLLINFCYLFDIGNNISHRIYYIQILISYIISFFLSYIIMIITKLDQLSSIIIYPVIVLSTIITGVIRGEFRKLLRGTLTTFEERQKKDRRNSF